MEPTTTHNDGGTAAQQVQNNALEAMQYTTKQAFQELKVTFINQRITAYERIERAQARQVLAFEKANEGLKDDDIDASVLEAWGKKQDDLFQAQSTLASLNFEKAQLVSQLNAWIKKMEHYGKEMDEQWDSYVEKLKVIIAGKKLKKGKDGDHSIESETMLRAIEDDFINREDRIEYFRYMIGIVGDRALKQN